MSKLLAIMKPKKSALIQAINTVQNKRLVAVKTKFPEAKRYVMVYTKSNGQSYSYEISSPIENTNDSFRCYCFNKHGIREFKNNKIVSLKEVVIKNVII